MTRIQNPILPGFNPDPSIVRVGDDYYIATSTFEWYPGVQIHHSRDLVNWRLVARPLVRAAQLDMRGAPDGCGVWAPDLSYADGRFHLIYTDVKRYGRTTVGGASGASLRDFHNYWVHCGSIDGDWSDPVHLNSSGFDPALFHDDDGRSYLLNMLWDHRPGRNRFAGIVKQEMDIRTGAMLGDRRMIFEGTSLGFTEGPHIYKRDGWYHLLVAEGGTMWNHAVTMARSRSIDGPYEVHPDGPVLTAKDKSLSPLQRTGHADLVDLPNGETWMVYLCGRPLPGRGRCVMGRETAIQPMAWGEDGWLRTLTGDATPDASPMAPALSSSPPSLPWPAEPEVEHFDGAELPAPFQWLRTPRADRLFSLTARPGHLRLYGRETIGSAHEQALVARRQTSWHYRATCDMDCDPQHFQQMAGITCYYNSGKYHYLYLTHDEDMGRHLRVMSVLPDSPQGDAFSAPVSVPAGPLSLVAEVDHHQLRFGYKVAGAPEWTWLPGIYDASILSDEASAPGLPNFTGAFVGVAAQDMAGTAMVADFDSFAYVNL